MSLFSVFVDGSEWPNETMRLNGAFLIAIDDIRGSSHSFAIPVWCVHEGTEFHLGNPGLVAFEECPRRPVHKIRKAKSAANKDVRGWRLLNAKDYEGAIAACADVLYLRSGA